MPDILYNVLAARPLSLEAYDVLFDEAVDGQVDRQIPVKVRRLKGLVALRYADCPLLNAERQCASTAKQMEGRSSALLCNTQGYQDSE